MSWSSTIIIIEQSQRNLASLRLTESHSSLRYIKQKKKQQLWEKGLLRDPVIRRHLMTNDDDERWTNRTEKEKNTVVTPKKRQGRLLYTNFWGFG